MAEPTLLEVDQDAFDAAEATVIALIRVAYPTLDLRRGTVLRDLLIRPAASVYALNTERGEYLQERQSITALLANESTVEASAVDAILSNFNVTRNSGDTSSGFIRVRVDADRTYTLTAGFQFVTLDGLVYGTSQTYTAKSNADTASGQLPLHLSDDGTYYYFIIPVAALEVGVEYNISEGTALDAGTSLFGFISAEAYSDFASGVDEESISEVVARLPEAISYRALDSRTSISAKLTDQFESSVNPIQTLSVQGYGDAAQLRDKHNPMGFAVGSRVDVYTKTFVAPQILTVEKTGTLIAPNTYQFTLEPSDAPGYYAIRSISELDSVVSTSLDFGTIPAIGSYEFAEVRAAYGIQDTFHDFDTANSMIETAYTVFQQATITVSGVPYTEATRSFKVEIYQAPGLAAIQAYIDSTPVRNVEADYIARCPLICLTGVEATVYHSSNVAIDLDAMKSDLYNYINTRGFAGKLTRSELACVLLARGASRIDLSDQGMRLEGTIRDASGVLHTLSGDSLDIDSVASPTSLLTADTCVFGIETRNIFLTAVAE